MTDADCGRYPAKDTVLLTIARHIPKRPDMTRACFTGNITYTEHAQTGPDCFTLKLV